MVNPLLDIDFLKKLDLEKKREVYAKVVSLNFEEQPIEEITGRITQGSINVDGTSAVRRTCSLSMVAKELNINDYYWGVNTKFKLYIGLKNTIEPKYPDIIWFPQGIYLFTSFNTSHSTSNYTISLQGKDKMSLLNGEIGGSLTALSYDFGSYDQIDEDGNVTNIKMLLKHIIKEIVHEYAREPFQNIIINDLDDYGIELLEYRGSMPMYFFIESLGDDSFDVVNMTLSSSQTIYYEDENGNFVEGTLADLQESDFNKLMQLEFIEGANNPKTVYLTETKDTAYTVAKIDYGETAGYRTTDLTYAGDLLASVGEAATAVLDKIKNMLGEFEYFYDIDGKFIFQKKKNYIQTSFNNIVRDNYVESAVLSSSYSYSFEDGVLISSFSNSPNLLNLRNDFSIWGTRTSVTGSELPVHLRYAIDEKPIYFKNSEGKIYISSLDVFNQLKENAKNKIIAEVKQKVEGYEPTYDTISVLDVPQKQADGSFSPGWWDIRDWYEYYTLLKGEEPNGTMKWYSQNDLTGCVPIKSIFPNWGNNTYCWLIVVRANGTFNFQHGSGDPSKNKDCYYYYSYLDPDDPNEVITIWDRSVPKKNFIYPYAGCSDDHTYLEFLKGDIEKDGSKVYFYNPAFPNQSYIEVLEEKIENEYNDYLESGIINFVDWREIIYQMAKDYRKHYHEDDYYVKLAKNNIDFYPNGKTGYEQYYTDMEGFWRQLYNPNPDPSYQLIDIEKEELEDNEIFLNTYRTISNINNDFSLEESYIQRDDIDLYNFYVYKSINEVYSFYNLYDAYCRINIDSNIYYKRIEEGSYELYTQEELSLINIEDIWVKVNNNSTQYEKYLTKRLRELKQSISFNDVYKYDNKKLNILDGEIKSIISDNRPSILERYILDNFGNVVKNEDGVPQIKEEKIYYYKQYSEYYFDKDNYNYWKKEIFDYPETLNFWIDFLDTTGTLGDYSVKAIGNRPKAINDNNVKAIYFRETPTVIFIDANNASATDRKAGYTYIQLQPGMDSLFSISSQGKSAMDVLDTNLYNHSYCIDSVSINAIPVYYLQPNTRIFIKDKNSNINGEYVLTRFTIPLNYNGTMSMTATKAAEEIY